MVGCIIVNYRSPLEMLKLCLESVIRESAKVPCRIILVDNASGDGIAGRVQMEFPQVEIVQMRANLGFAAAVNRGLEEVREAYVLTLNTDAVLAEGALEKMVLALDEAGADVAGIAPKMLSSSHEGIIDAVGIIIPPSGAAFNRGIGQCDLGQYDRRDEVAGVCFGAGLIRRSLFGPGAVGPLYEGYFLYFEDSDWCMRAFSRGYRFLVEPEAVVMHMHSGVTRHESLDFKYGLIELNTLKMVTRNFERNLLTGRIAFERCLRLLARTFVRRKFIGPNLRTLAAYLRSLPMLLGERRQLKARRTVPDSSIFELAKGENAYFDTVAYRPDRTIDSLIDTHLRLMRLKADPALGKQLTALYRLKQEAMEGRLRITEDTLELFAGEPPCVWKLIESAGGRI